MDYQEALVALEESVARSPQEARQRSEGNQPFGGASIVSNAGPGTTRICLCHGYRHQQIRKRTRERQRPNP